MVYSEADICAKLIDSHLQKYGWLESYIVREYYFVYTTNGHKIYECNLITEKGIWIKNFPSLQTIYIEQFHDEKYRSFCTLFWSAIKKTVSKRWEATNSPLSSN